MIRYLIRHLIPNYQDTRREKVRQQYGMLAGTVGMICNLGLFALKICIAWALNSLSVAADAFNNLSDAGSSIVTWFGFHLSSRPPDEDHPFGHGRAEYVAALVVAFLIVAVGLQFLRSSLERICNPEVVRFGWLAVGLLTASLGVKLWMFGYNRYIGRVIGSQAIQAAAFDSLSDVLVTTLALLSLLLTHFTDAPLDGWFGLAVGAFVIYGGVKIIRETLSPLLGQKPDPELVEHLRKRLLSYPEIIEVHDIILNNYGPGRYIASAHAEADCRADPFALHDVFDRAEKEIGSELSMHLTLHFDPVDPADPERRHFAGLAEECVFAVDPLLQIHDLRLERLADGRIKLHFDVVTPRGYRCERSKLRRRLIEALRRADGRLEPVIEIENSYT